MTQAVPKKSWKPTFKDLLKLLAALISSVFIVKIIKDLGPERVWDITLQADPFLLAPAIGLLVAMFAVWAWKWRLIAARGFDLPFAWSFRLIWLGNFINTFTPTAKLGGGFMRAIRLRRGKGMSLGQAYGWVMADQISSFLGKALLFGTTCLLVSFLEEMAQWRLALRALGLVCFAVIGAWFPLRRRFWHAAVNRKRTGRFQNWIPKMLRGAEQEKEDQVAVLLEPTLKLGRPRDIFFLDICLASFAFALFCLSNGLVLKALGASASLVVIGLAVMLSYLGGTLLGFLGGIGITELLLIKIYSLAGVPEDTAAAGALLHRAIFYLFSFAWGGYAAWRERQLGRLHDVMK